MQNVTIVATTVNATHPAVHGKLHLRI